MKLWIVAAAVSLVTALGAYGYLAMVPTCGPEAADATIGHVLRLGGC